ncbi:MAG: DUF362 domain-containing protein [Candidatus Bathyarchaeota archaeon]|nr:MAG: DUF362 domain-containing protein [Candidatus Bathyarchaeota archaeon]
MTSIVSLVHGDDRYSNVQRSLDLICDEIKAAFNGKRRILVKPNLVSTSRQLAATHVESVKAVLDFLFELNPTEVIIAEGSAGDTFSAYRNFGYLTLRDSYGIDLVDLDKDDYIEVPILNRDYREILVRVAKTMLDFDFRVSLAIPKTHDCVIITESLKNVVVGSLVDGDKSTIHQGFPVQNLDLYKIASLIPPHLAVIDGFEGMEGNGPVGGDRVEMRVAFSSCDFISADAVGAALMGFNPLDIGYLFYAHKFGLGCADLGSINVVGESVENHVRSFKPHRRYDEQKRWRIPEDKFKLVLEWLKQE